MKNNEALEILKAAMGQSGPATGQPEEGRHYLLDEEGEVEALMLNIPAGKKLQRVIPLLKNFKRLRRLEITGSSLADLSFLEFHPFLTHLKIGNCQLCDTTILEKLQLLDHLELVSTNFYHLNFIDQLRNLTQLNLSGNERIADYSRLIRLHKLKKLRLGGAAVRNILFMDRLEYLDTLELESTDIHNISVLKGLNGLGSLSLKNNKKISDFTPLMLLYNLTELDLRNNYIRDCSFLNELGDLRKLDISDNSIIDMSPIIALGNLKELNLSLNKGLKDITPLMYLTGLTNLDISNTAVRKADSFGCLTELTYLNIGVTNIENSAPMESLTQLTYLDMQKTFNVTEFSFLKNMPLLTHLNVSETYFSDTSLLAGLSGLTSLNLNNTVFFDLTGLKELGNLTRLSLSGNDLADISVLAGLKKLEYLEMNRNRLENIGWVKDLPALKELHAEDNSIKEVDSFLCELHNIEKINLSKNHITTLPEGPWNLGRLEYMLLAGNQIAIFPYDFFRAPMSWLEDDPDLARKEFPGLKEEYGTYVAVEYYLLTENPLKTPPPEIVRAGRASISNYFQQLEQQSEDYLFEAKLLIIGEPGAGKTTMTRKLTDPWAALPKEEDSTKGIEVVKFRFPLQPEDLTDLQHPEKLKKGSFCLNIWDFGGQEIYKATHRFFLSRRSIYALIADNRNENTDFNYWLHIVEMFGGDSPLLIVLNEKFQRKRNLDVSSMRQRFVNICEVLDVDFAEEDKTRLMRLEKAIRYYVSLLPHIGSMVPSRWRVIRDLIDNDNRNTLTLDEYLYICLQQGVNRENALFLSQYFHDIGVFLHFQDDELLNRTIFLKPNWATKAVYKVLDHELLNRGNGKFSKEDTRIIWNEEEHYFLRFEFLRLMQKFFLAYEVENTGTFMVPERLSAGKPGYYWEDEDNLFLQYEYDLFMPKGIMSQFIVQMYRYISNHNIVWRGGVILERGEAFAEVIETYDARNINIRVRGRHRRDFMTIITEKLDQINQQYEKMKVEKKIPCNCTGCKGSVNPWFFRYKDLMRRLDNEKYDIECEKHYEMVNVSGLIDEVLITGERNTPAARIGGGSRPLSVGRRDILFICYSHSDKEVLKRIQVHIRTLEKEGIQVNSWDDTKIRPGTDWKEEIRKALSACKAAVLIVSTDFLASEFIVNYELPALLEAAKNRGTTILPLIAKPCRFEKSQLSSFQAVNDVRNPLSKLLPDEQDEVLIRLADHIEEIFRPG